MSRNKKEIEYGDWSSLTPLEIAKMVLEWEDDRSALNRKYSQILAKEVERLTIESRVESHRHATIARDNANLRAEVERLRAELESSRQMFDELMKPIIAWLLVGILLGVALMAVGCGGWIVWLDQVLPIHRKDQVEWLWRSAW